MRTEPFSLSLSTPLDTAAGTIDERRGFLVRLDLDGTPGLGEATPLPGWTESLDDCEAALREVDDPETALDGDSFADAPAARHGVSLAVLDARARAAGEPLYRHLGANTRIEEVPVNATVGDGEPKETAEAAADAVNKGFPAVKVKVGARPLAEDVERFEAVRTRCPDVELRADANGAWDRETAERALSAFADHDVAFVEQPLSADELSGHTDLRGGPVGIALDEGLHEHGIDAVLDAAAADVIVIKPMALGGVDRAADAGRRAIDAGLDVVVTTTIDGAVARAAAVHLAAALPGVRASGLATRRFLDEDIRENVAPIRSGAAVVPQGKGNIPPS
ncbi:mandelate racemase/muconate lactonizing enzyme family protein [Natronomonas amylolytica]|uniref:mandelate racemase/muconate lactonizing enzyme family protein n=1 Tax=Natronomonas amylolytica TaxID=3108498 RepID=UPI00300AA67B